MSNPAPLEPGKRLILAGKTGSGKSVALTRAIVDQPLRGIILDTKEEPEFKKLPHSVLVDGLDGVDFDSFNLPSGPDFVIVRPQPDEMDPDVLDDFLFAVYESAENILIGVDELYTVALGTHPRRGITAVYTRGRSRRISMIAATQRPRWFPRFCITEADEIYQFFLNDPDDRDHIASMCDPVMRKNPLDKYTFWSFKMGATEARIEGPVIPLPVPRNTVAEGPKRHERVRLL